jgi:hypothetical protein
LIEDLERNLTKPITRYQYDQRPQTKLAPGSEGFIEALKNSEYSVLVGRNNCGKSWMLKTLTHQWGQSTSYLGPARYQNFNLLGYFTPNRSKRSQRKWQDFINLWNKSQENIDNSPVNLQQAIAELSDDQRERLSEIMHLLLGFTLDIRNTVSDNSMSQKYISCGEHNISFTSSGFRLITTLITSLLDDECDTFLIDEPELGISPEAQGVLADFLVNREARKKYFPHIKTLILATHSTIFLDRKHISNNYQIQKDGDDITISRVATIAEFNRIHFFLLGNRFETLYLPTGIVIVEGKTDYRFIERVVALRYPQAQISILQANSDDRIKEVLNIAKGLFSDIQKSPYRQRILVVLDAIHSATLPQEIKRLGVPIENVITWQENGIEYVYPPAVLDQIFGTGGALTIDGDVVERNGLQYKKNDLATKVVDALRPETEMHPEFADKFLSLLELQFQVGKS